LELSNAGFESELELSNTGLESELELSNTGLESENNLATVFSARVTLKSGYKTCRSESFMSSMFQLIKLISDSLGFTYS